MKRFYVILSIALLSIVSCKKNQDKNSEKLEQKVQYNHPKDSVKKYSITQLIQAGYLDSIVDWKGYHQFKASLDEMKAVSANEILARSTELVDEVLLMKDSMNISTLNIKGVNARLNGLYNQVKRIEDMEYIPSITADEVHKTTEELFVLFDILNTKINDVYEQINFKNTLKEEEFFFIEKDTVL